MKRIWLIFFLTIVSYQFVLSVNVDRLCATCLSEYKGPLTRTGDETTDSIIAEHNRKKRELYNKRLEENLAAYQTDAANFSRSLEVEQRRLNGLAPTSRQAAENQKELNRVVDFLKSSSSLGEVRARARFSKELDKGVTEKTARLYNKKVNEVFEQVNEVEPNVIEVTDSVNELYDEMQESEVSSTNEELIDYIDKKLFHEGLVDEEGLVYLPHVGDDGAYVEGDKNSIEYLEVRMIVNNHRANKSMIENYCKGTESTELECGILRGRNAMADLTLQSYNNLESQWPQFKEKKGFFRAQLEKQVAFTKGFLNGGWRAVKGLASAVYNYDETYDALKYAVTNPKKVFHGLVDATKQLVHKFKTCEGLECNELYGEVGFEVISSVFVGAKAGAFVKSLKNFSKGNKLAQKIGKILVPAVQAKLHRGTEWVSGTASYVRYVSRVDGVGGIKKIREHVKVIGSGTLANFARAEKKLNQHFNLTTGGSLSSSTTDFILNSMRYQSALVKTGMKFDVDSMFDVAVSFQNILTKMSLINGKSLTNATVTRAVWKEFVQKRFLKKDIKIINDASTVFNFHPGTFYGNGRFSPPGVSALYTTYGKNIGLAKDTIIREFAKDGVVDVNQLVFASKQITFDRVLDLTDVENVLSRLGVFESGLLKHNDYWLTHQVGYAAKELGFEAIAVQSAQGNAVNIVILRKFK